MQTVQVLHLRWQVKHKAVLVVQIKVLVQVAKQKKKILLWKKLQKNSKMLRKLFLSYLVKVEQAKVQCRLKLLLAWLKMKILTQDFLMLIYVVQVFQGCLDLIIKKYIRAMKDGVQYMLKIIQLSCLQALCFQIKMTQ